MAQKVTGVGVWEEIQELVKAPNIFIPWLFPLCLLCRSLAFFWWHQPVAGSPSHPCSAWGNILCPVFCPGPFPVTFLPPPHTHTSACQACSLFFALGLSVLSYKTRQFKNPS